MYRRRGRARGRANADPFNPDDTNNVTHTKYGVWDVYEDKPSVLTRIPIAARLEPYYDMIKALPYILRMLKDIASMPSCLVLLVLRAVLSLGIALLPALSLWYSGQLLAIAQQAVDERKVDKHQLFTIAAGRVFCTIASRLIDIAQTSLQTTFNSRVKQHFSMYMFRVVSRLDVPTFNDNLVQEQLAQAVAQSSSSTVVAEVVTNIMFLSRTMLSLLSQSAVLISVLRDQPDGALLAVIACLPHLVTLVSSDHYMTERGAWVITTKNADYIKMEGLKRLINSGSHRQEIVAGGMWKHLVNEYCSRVVLLGDMAIQSAQQYLRQARRQRLSRVLSSPLSELPQIIFTLRVAERPLSIPTSLASLNLISTTTTQFSHEIWNVYFSSANMAENVARLRGLYEIDNIQNQVEDGSVPYPENQADLQLGVAVEFRNVSFRYPDASEYALRNVSFSIKQGQLCVIVGNNGSGKSTILKLIARLYDPAEGTIYVDGHDIKSLSLDDLRRATAVLFQDYTHFPLSIGDNIGLGDPENSTDMGRIEEAARLGGADVVVNKMPEGFDTYLDRPVRDIYSALPEGTKTLFGRPVEYAKLRGRGGLRSADSSSLSGGQMQRIALSRTFMRTLSSDKTVGLLLFDEPSASLDPTAEHDLFERLRRLRGSKTMIFSSHRFGNLTRHADMILYMNDSVVVEEGTHANLLASDGEYARIWKLQAQAFL